MILRSFQDTRGATSIEYAIIAGLIALVILVSVGLLGGSVSNKWNGISQNVSKAK